MTIRFEKVGLISPSTLNVDAEYFTDFRELALNYMDHLLTISMDKIIIWI